ncbi:MAG: NAD-dependent epimerase [Hyphomicrobium aestuarii]|nr:NAD-dependent epimerase [Hyphomicrobium aestuarii]
MKVLVTGAAGFIGFHLAKALIARGDSVVGLDSVDAYYDPELKEARLRELARLCAPAANRTAPGSSAAGTSAAGKFEIVRGNIADRSVVEAVFASHSFDRVVNLAAQAGVRYSLENPHAYVESNLIGFTNLLEACRHAKVPHLTYASTSSVYGANTTMPFSERNGADHPIQFYAATKRANELMAHSYSHLFGLPTTGLRFFTVYGPWGRPDMALFLFTKNILAGEPIKVFNHGQHTRDFTYVEDIVDGVIRASDDIAKPDPAWDGAHPNPSTSSAPYRIFNIGNTTPVSLMTYIEAIETAVGRKATMEMLPLQQGDVPSTFADISALTAATGFQPRTSVQAGVAAFVAWYRDYYRA